MPVLGKEYKMSVEFQALGTSSGGSNNLNSVIQFSKLGPAVFVRHDNKKFRKVNRKSESDRNKAKCLLDAVEAPLSLLHNLLL